MRIVRKIKSVLAAVLIVPVLLGGSAVLEGSALAVSGQHIVLTIDGLACPYCAYGLRKRLLVIEGVTDAEVVPESSRVLIEVASGSEIDDDQIRQAISRAHFSGGEISRQESQSLDHRI